MRCQHETYHDDMYPEFAPEPIVLRCDARATVHHLIAEDVADDGGWPRGGVREVVHIWACQEHAEDWSLDGQYWNPFNPRLIRTEITQEGTD
jgi:hypothetical protein